MSIFIIDNGLPYDMQETYFVEAPAEFGEWFAEVLVPWLKRHALRGSDAFIVGVSESIKWRKLPDHDPTSGRTNVSMISFQEFLADDLVIEEMDYEDWKNPEHRPTFHGV